MSGKHRQVLLTPYLSNTLSRKKLGCLAFVLLLSILLYYTNHSPVYYNVYASYMQYNATKPGNGLVYKALLTLNYPTRPFLPLVSREPQVFQLFNLC